MIVCVWTFEAVIPYSVQLYTLKNEILGYFAWPYLPICQLDVYKSATSGLDRYGKLCAAQSIGLRTPFDHPQFVTYLGPLSRL